MKAPTVARGSIQGKKRSYHQDDEVLQIPEVYARIARPSTARC
jgi:hypothetical protein